MSTSAWDEIYYKPLSKSWGAPPWNIFMMVNILPTSKQTSSKRTEIRIHSNPATVESVQNALYPANHQIWKVIMIIGPFYDAKRTLDLFKEWSSRSRGCKSRINIGINIFQSNYKNENLVLYVIKKKRPELIRDMGVVPNNINPIWAWGENHNGQKKGDYDFENSMNEGGVDTVLQKWWHYGNMNNTGAQQVQEASDIPLKADAQFICNKTLGWINSISTLHAYDKCFKQ